MIYKELAFVKLPRHLKIKITQRFKMCCFASFRRAHIFMAAELDFGFMVRSSLVIGQFVTLNEIGYRLVRESFSQGRFEK